MLRPPAAKLAAIVLVAAALQSCAAPRGLALPDLGDWETRNAVLQSVDRWEFRGRIGVSAGEEGFNGKLHWQQRGDRFDVTVSGPLGVGTVKIEGDGQRMQLTDNEGVVTELGDAERDLRERYGWPIPVASLRYWTLGIPDPGYPATTRFDETGQLASIEQNGWTVAVGQYGEGGGQAMPRRVTAQGDDARVRLVVDKWTFY